MPASPSDTPPKRGGLLGRLFGGGDRPKQTTVTVDAYELESSGLSEVVGESYYQDALVATRAVLRRDDRLDCDVFDAILVAEPDNEYDSEAVAVYSTRGKIGHAPRGSGWFEVLSILNENGHAAATCRASLTGGDNHRELGAILHGDPDGELERLER